MAMLVITRGYIGITATGPRLCPRLWPVRQIKEVDVTTSCEKIHHRSPAMFRGPRPRYLSWGPHSSNVTMVYANNELVTGANLNQLRYLGGPHIVAMYRN